LINDGNSLLDITSLGHGNNGTILDIKNSVLLEDRAEHGLDDDRWAWVGDERRLLMQLSGEEINAQVSVLTSGSRGGDTDHLAWAALEDQEITNTDVVARDGNGVGSIGRLSGTDALWLGSIIIVVTHFGEGTRLRIDGLFGDASLLVERLRCARGIDGLLCEADLFFCLMNYRRWVDSGTCDANLFLIGWLLEARRVDSRTCDTGTGLLGIGELREAGRVNSGVAETTLFWVGLGL